jgi:DNA-binding beta-propeller fold protein YncE
LSSREENTVPTVSRIENIKIAKHQCVMSDSINNKVYIHPIVNNSELNINTTQTLSDAMQLPHGVAFSPDSKLLVVTNYGLKTEQGRVLWTQFTQPRSDSILIYSTQETPL